MTTATTTQTAVPTGTWVLDPGHSSVDFRVKHIGIANVRGAFNEFEGRLEAAENGELKAYGKVKAASVDTNEAARDQHLRSADFFDTEQYEYLTFESTKIELDDGDITVIGDLSLHGVISEVTLKGEVTGTEEDPWGNQRVGLELYGQLSRGDYAMKFNQALGSGNMLVSDKVKLELQISAVKL